MRQYIAAAILAASPAVAQDPFLTGEALTQEVTKDCAEGCLVMNREQFAHFSQQMNEVLIHRENRAFEAGKQQGNLSCRNAI